MKKYKGSGGDVIIPENVKSIGNGVFYNRKNLTSVTIPDSVTSIGKNAFCDCRILSYCRIPETVRFIADNAFDGCDSLVLAVTAGSHAEDYALRLSIRYVISE